MKAVIIEINKNYCILITGEGRFLKKRIKVGSVEIGDEIIIENEAFPLSVSKKTWIRGFGIAFAVLAVIIAGTTFGYRYLRQSTPMALSASAVAEPTTSAEEDKNQSMKMGAEAQSQGSVPTEASETAGVQLFEKIYNFEKDNILAEDSLDNLNLIFSFKVTDNNERNLSIELKNDNSKIFSGNLNFNMLDSGGKATRTITMEINGLRTGNNKKP